MNALEEYINQLNPSFWLNAQHVNGYGVAQPADNSAISEWKDISGNGLVSKQSWYVSPIQPIFKIGSDGLGYIETSGTSGGVLTADLRSISNIYNNDFTEVLVFKGLFNRYGYAQATRIDNLQQGTENINASYTFKKYNYATYPVYQACISNVQIGVSQNLYNIGYLVDNYAGSTVRGNLPNASGGGYSNHAGLFSIGGLPNLTAPPAYGNGVYATFFTTKTLACESIYFNRSLSLSEIKKVQTYLKLKYNI